MTQAANLRAQLAPLLAGDLAGWRGLPTATVQDFDALFGTGATPREEVLGAQPAQHRHYRDAARGGQGLDLWSRDGVAVMVQPEGLPPSSALAALGPPERILAHEILVPGHYAHEYLYSARGLVLTVAQPLAGDRDALHIVRCRGFAALADPDGFGAGLYLAFEDRTVWAGLPP